MGTGPGLGRTGRSQLLPYVPLVVIAALQLVILTRPSHTTSVASGPAASPHGQTVAGANTAAPDAAAGEQSSAVQQATPAAAGTSEASAKAAQSSPTKAGPSAVGSAAAASEGQTVDALGRPLTGDKSKCAPGGVIQENVTRYPFPCTPKLVGDNGAATYQGVTADSISTVVVFPQYPDGVQQGLVAAGLSMTPEQAHEVDGLFAQFLNKHYELYGRQIKVAEYFTPSADGAALRADAKAINEKFKPFAVLYYGQSLMPEPMADQLTQLGIVTLGAPSLSDAWYKQHAPFAWTLSPQGDRQADMLADYYCKKMWGKNATLASDPTMKVKKRKLGIIANESPAQLEPAQRFKAAVTGGMCGTENDGTTLYTVSADPTTAQNQQAALVSRMKNDGITTQASLGGPPGSQEDDRQQYYPENLQSGLFDDDLVGRFFAAAGSPTQLNNTFGVGWYPEASPVSEHDHAKAAHDVNPSYDTAYLAEGPWNGLSFLAKLAQWAGPHLTPKNIEQGAHTSPQLGGWTIAKRWAGWKCCDPFAPVINLTGADSYTGWADSKEVYWDSKAISKADNQPGAWVCVDPNCRRYQAGQWPKGEPKQPAAA